MLLSVDWDFYSGTLKHVFDAPLWGTPDREFDRLERWRERARKRDFQANGWEVLASDFPLFGNPRELLAYAGLPTFVAWSHAHAWEWLERYPNRDVLNFDSHHDLYSKSGDFARVRPGNWAGLALKRGLVLHYTCVYPSWHQEVRVSEGYDLERTWEEVRAHLDSQLWPRVTLSRASALPRPAEVESLLLVQSPAWTSPAHDEAFLDVGKELRAEEISAPHRRPWS